MRVIKILPAFLFLVITGISFSCKKTDSGPAPLPQPTDSLQKINRWILDSMLYYYLWSDQLTQYPSLSESPSAFFTGLLNPQDRFSWISNGAGVAPGKSAYERFGFHYILIDHPAQSGNNLVGIVTLVAPGSPADKAGLSRGDYFLKVNDELISNQNTAGIAAMLKENGVVKLAIAVNQNGSWTDNGTRTITPAYFEERPVFLRKVFKKDNIVTGYLFYNNFSETFDKDILDALDSLKTRQVTELILDLRYNPGGSIATAAKMTAAIIYSLSAQSVFARLKGNSRLGTIDYTFEKAIASSGNPYKKDFSQLRSNSLGLNRIFILSGSNTASAAEMMINNLSPFMTVVHIGEKTLGKDKAGVLIKDLRQPKQVYWFMQPLVFGIFNSTNAGNYSTGLSPQYPVVEYAEIPLQNIGNNNEVMIKKALEIIYGTSQLVSETFRKKDDVHIIRPHAVRFNSLNEINKALYEINVHQ